MTRSRDETIYAIEAMAFDGHPLGDRIDRGFAMRHTVDVAARLYPMLGDVDVHDARADMTSATAYARGQSVFFSASARKPWYIVAHELAHVAMNHAGMRGVRHEQPWRDAYVLIVGTVYGESPAYLLHSSFEEAGFEMGAFPVLPDRPFHDIERLAARTVRFI